jgi:hypothetical protein
VFTVFVFRIKLYYGIKPLVPLFARLAVRRWLALRKREKVRDVWPVMPAAGRSPRGWPGWPEGKQFALVLTHDVEGQAGLDKCRQLMELEKQLGFRSCFNFVPENGYSVPRELREELAANGFEVGVHDLYHNGKLFLQKKEFSRNAVKINRYLKDWGAAGFRSAFMLHNLQWIHELNVLYDTSTFDTDPFEPQPHGQGTIFPFWVARNAERQTNQEAKAHHSSPLGSLVPHQPSAPSTFSSGGYVELPYTLPQDSTLFLILRERNPDIWFQKLEWVARHGGMALVNVHPDYLQFDGQPASGVGYPAGLYAQFLDYARQRFRDSFWQVNPAELARWYKGTPLLSGVVGCDVGGSMDFKPTKLAERNCLDPQTEGSALRFE